VGDPMQSIYRFRGAEVGLFLHAERHGIGPVRLVSLQLRSNFRASETLVNWVNQQFKTIFPEQDDLESGAISYHHATAVHATEPSDKIHAYQYTSRAEEAEAIVELIKQELSAHPSNNIALLVRTRKQLTTITQTLRAHHMPYQGVDIDWMSHLSHVRDVWSLTQALLMPANRLAWLSFLRSPWCGLSLDDLHLIANINRHRSIYHALAPQDSHQNLSHEGQQRVRYIYHTLHHALQHRHQQSLAQWIIRTLEELHLHVLLSDTEQDDLEQYWQLLDTYEQDGQLADLKRFKTALDTLYSKRITPSRLHIMTIHKAKGLEFDCVILPCLNARAVSQDKPLLRWLTLPTSASEPLVLMSPLKADSQDHCTLYDYLSKLNTEKEHYEQQRLLYVAITRAKKRLYLLTHHHGVSQGTFRALLKQQPFIPIDSTQVSTSEDKQQQSHHAMLDYLPSEFYTLTPTPHSTALTSTSTSLLISDDVSRVIGVIAHELLQWICTHHPQTEHDVPWHMATYALKQRGFDTTFIQQTEQQLKAYIVPLFHTSRGQWLIQAHEQERNEYELLITHQQNMHTRIIDRFFYAQETPWIIDFKTGYHDTSNEAKHRAQVDAYAEHLHHRILKPIRRGLYYLSTQHWVEW
jgi:ATP-dependent exoDNAse (exonuclease V) beta subunit